MGELSRTGGDTTYADNDVAEENKLLPRTVLEIAGKGRKGSTELVGTNTAICIAAPSGCVQRTLYAFQT